MDGWVSLEVSPLLAYDTASTLAAAPLVTLYKQYVVRFGLGYTEQPRSEADVVGYTEPVGMHYAQPAPPR